MSRSEESPVTWRDIMALSDRISRLEESTRSINDELTALTSRLDKLSDSIESIKSDIHRLNTELIVSVSRDIHGARDQFNSEFKMFKSLIKRIVYAFITMVTTVLGTIIIMVAQKII